MGVAGRIDVDRPNVTILKGDARDLDLPDDSVDLIVTSPPYFGLRSYQDGGEHYAEQIGAEATPAEFVDALIDCTREWMRVLKPSGSIWVNLGDKYASGGRGSYDLDPGRREVATSRPKDGARPKSLLGIPWRYAIRCIDELGLILRAEVIWSKPNGLPESVTDRVRRSHEQWFHFTLEPRYYSAVDEIREPHVYPQDAGRARKGYVGNDNAPARYGNTGGDAALGKLPGSVWTVPTEPLHVPDHLGVDHFAAFPTEFPRRIIQGWSPREVCEACGEGRRPVSGKAPWWESYKAEHGISDYNAGNYTQGEGYDAVSGKQMSTTKAAIPPGPKTVITGYACACPDTTAPTTPGVVLDPFGGTGTTALVASVLGRHGISNDMSSDYNCIAEWRTTDPKQRAKAARKPYTPAAEQVSGQLDLFDLGDAS